MDDGNSARTADPHTLILRLRDVALANGLDALGVASSDPFESTRADLERRRQAGLSADMMFTYRNPQRSTEPQRLMRTVRSLVVGARNYHRRLPEEPGPGPHGTVGRYVWEDHYGALRVGLDAVADVLREQGYRAAVFIDGNELVDREAAYRAGLGWYGKNTNLLLDDRGSWFVLGSVATDADLPPAEPQPDGCGSCRRCLDSCPTNALPQPGVLDANRCLAWLAQRPGPFPLEFRAALGDRIYGCDDCQTVCPPNRRYESSVNVHIATAPVDGAWVGLVELLDADDETLVARHGRWYLAQRRTFALRRNALLALGNVADADDPAVRAALCRYLHHPDPLLRATTVWALRRLGLDSLAATAATDADEAVRVELHVTVERR